MPPLASLEREIRHRVFQVKPEKLSLSNKSPAAKAGAAHLPYGGGRLIGKVGDRMNLGPVPTAAMTQMDACLLAETSAPITTTIRPFSRLQIGIRDPARQALAAGQPPPDRARRALRVWFILGWPAVGALTMVFWLMITKPALWG